MYKMTNFNFLDFFFKSSLTMLTSQIQVDYNSFYLPSANWCGQDLVIFF